VGMFRVNRSWVLEGVVGWVLVDGSYRIESEGSSMIRYVIRT
jgi:hypothetical protein